MKKIWILWLLNFYQRATFHGLFNYEHRSQDGICPYIFGDKDYPFLTWFIVPHKHATFVKHTILEVIFNKHYEKKGCFATHLATNYIYTPWMLTDKLHQLQNYNLRRIRCNSLQLNCNSIKTTHFQLMCNSIIIAPMMSCWCHWLSSIY
jgi:hypothetical protein